MMTNAELYLKDVREPTRSAPNTSVAVYDHDTMPRPTPNQPYVPNFDPETPLLQLEILRVGRCTYYLPKHI